MKEKKIKIESYIKIKIYMNQAILMKGFNINL